MTASLLLVLVLLCHSFGPLTVGGFLDGVGEGKVEREGGGDTVKVDAEVVKGVDSPQYVLEDVAHIQQDRDEGKKAENVEVEGEKEAVVNPEEVEVRIEDVCLL